MVDLDKHFGFIVNDVARLLRQRFDQRAQDLGLTRTQWRALGHIKRQEGIHQAALAENLEVEPITLARLIDRLEARDFVERRSDPADRRAWRLYLTPKAAPVLERMIEIGDANLAHAMVGLSAAEVDTLSATLLRIKSNLSDPTLGSPLAPDAGLRRAGGRHG
jgi:MarR family transcriptional regulator, transcriptional regulator for hemolysin